MKHLLIALLCLTVSSLQAESSREMLIIVSEPGDGDYALEFTRQANIWENLAAAGEMAVTTIGLDERSPDGDLPRLQETLSVIPKSGDDLWIVWIGHGSYDWRTPHFNLRGKDIDPEAVAELIQPFQRRLIILNLFSASAPFIPVLAGDNRIILSAGRSPGERNYSRFGEKLADTVNDPAADLDLDATLSLLEASLYAAAATTAFYEDAQRVLSEHAVIDDNGDGLATSLDTFDGFRAEKVYEDALSADGLSARDIYFLKSAPDRLSPEAKEERAKIEAKIDALRERKSIIPEDLYYSDLERLMRDMAKLYQMDKE